jgi:hypothetical protein
VEVHMGTEFRLLFDGLRMDDCKNAAQRYALRMITSNLMCSTPTELLQIT